MWLTAPCKEATEKLLRGFDSLLDMEIAHPGFIFAYYTYVAGMVDGLAMLGCLHTAVPGFPEGGKEKIIRYTGMRKRTRG